MEGSTVLKHLKSFFFTNLSWHLCLLRFHRGCCASPKRQQWVQRQSPDYWDEHDGVLALLGTRTEGWCSTPPLRPCSTPRCPILAIAPVQKTWEVARFDEVWGQRNILNPSNRSNQQYLDEKMRTPDVPAELEKEVRWITVERSHLEPSVPCILPTNLNLKKTSRCENLTNVRNLSRPPLKHDPCTFPRHIILSVHEGRAL